jgi:DNA polymerase III subunit gamma/tau
VSYLVLARKYRPQRFEDLVGQEHVARTLTNAITLGRVHHGFLFTGARGIGKTSAARILAKALCCAHGPTATPCGTCGFCKEIVSGQSVDVVEIDGASNRGVDDARNLRESVRYAPAKGRKKVYIIDEVHMFTSEAFNALLKTLEEPPSHVVFILATTEAHKIPITILSRCQRYDFKLISTSRMVDHLSTILKDESIEFDPEGLRLLARQAAGSVRDALSLLDQVIAYVGDAPLSHERVVEVLGVADRRLLVRLYQAVLGRDPALALRALAGEVDRGVDLVQLSRAFLGFLHDVEISGLVPDAADLVDATAEELTEARALAQQAPRGLLGSLFDRWARAVEEAGRSQTPRLILEMALVDLCFTEPLVPLGDLLKRLEDLEGRLLDGPGGGGGPGPGAGPKTRLEPAARRSGPSSPSWGGASAHHTPAPPAPKPAPKETEKPTPAGANPTAAQTTKMEPWEGSNPPASTRISIDDGWNLLRLKLQERPALAAVLDHAEVAGWERGRVTLLFADKFLLDRAEKQRDVVERVLEELMGVPTALVLKTGGGTAPIIRSEAAREADAVAQDRRQREDEARRHPIIRKAQELFGVAPREIKLP